MKPRHLLLPIVIFLAAGQTLLGENTQQREEKKHEIRLGIGGQWFETLMWNEPRFIINSEPVTSSYIYKERYRYVPHISFEYNYRPNRWFGYGLMMDSSNVMWDSVTRNGRGEEMGREKNQYFNNFIVMPTVRFTYLNKDHFNLYSGLGVGIDINSGTETDAFGNHVDFSPAINLNLIGLSYSYNQWFAALEIGSLSALKSRLCVFLVNSRAISMNIGMRF